MKSYCDCHRKYKRIYRVLEAPQNFVDESFYYCDKGYERYLKNRMNWKERKR